MATQKTEKPSNPNPNQNPTVKVRKPRTPHTPTALELRVTESLHAQKAVARALRGVAKAVSKLPLDQAHDVLETALESLKTAPAADGEAAGS